MDRLPSADSAASKPARRKGISERLILLNLLLKVGDFGAGGVVLGPMAGHQAIVPRLLGFMTHGVLSLSGYFGDKGGETVERQWA